MKGMRSLGFAVVAVGLLAAACNDSESYSAPAGTPYDPSKPVEFYTFEPDSGGMRTKCIIKGSNFGTDIENIKVLFDKTREARVISSSGDMIYCLVPKQPAGNNSVSVVIGEDTVTCADKTFGYSVKESVTTVVGKNDVAGDEDGTLTGARFRWTCGLGMVTGNNLLISERFDWRIRMAALNENTVVTLVTGIQAGKPAITKDGKTAYFIRYGTPHTVYKLEQDNLWLPRTLAEDIPGFDGAIQCACFGPDEEWLYFRDNAGKFGRINLEDPGIVELLNPNCGSTINATDNHLVWHPQMNCFLMSEEFAHGIYKVSLDGKTVEEYVGFKGVGGQDGYLDEAQMTSPMGMSVDRDGNIYVAQVQCHTIRKIAYPSGLVSTIAGSYGVAGAVDGVPYLSRFNGPWDIVMDEEENFYIGQFWGVSVRKLAIE